jgi:hypothetical protein
VSLFTLHPDILGRSLDSLEAGLWGFQEHWILWEWSMWHLEGTSNSS